MYYHHETNYKLTGYVYDDDLNTRRPFYIAAFKICVVDCGVHDRYQVSVHFEGEVKLVGHVDLAGRELFEVLCKQAFNAFDDRILLNLCLERTVRVGQHIETTTLIARTSIEHKL